MSDLIPSWLGLETGQSFAWLGMRSGISLRWSLTLLHFLWQGAIIGVLTLIAARLLRNQSAVLRYRLQTVALLLCPFSVALTFMTVEIPQVMLRSTSSDNLTTSPVPVADNGVVLEDIPYPVLRPSPDVAPTNTESITAVASMYPSPAIAPPSELETAVASDSLPGWVNSLAPWLTIIYIAGVVCFLVRLAIAMWGGQRLRAIAKPVVDGALLQVIQEQSRRIGLKFVPAVAWCERIAVPTVIGVLRPMILLPATLTTGLSEVELSAILSHELAHIRRYDLWMNLLQRVIECLLFFHPVIWILSRRVSAEREICCDDLVVRSGHQPMNYAGALLRMAELCVLACRVSKVRSEMEICANGGSMPDLQRRIHRLMDYHTSRKLNWTFAWFILAFFLSVLSGVFLASSQRTNNTAKAAPLGEKFNGEIRIEGNSQLTTEAIRQIIKTDERGPWSDETIRNERRNLMASRWFFSVETRTERTPKGMTLVFVVHERPQIHQVQFRGQQRLTTRELEDTLGADFKPGAPFDSMATKQAITRLRQYYRRQGFGFVDVRLQKGSSPDDREVIFEIEEGPRLNTCDLNLSELRPRLLSTAIADLNAESLENSTGVEQPPVAEHELRNAIAKFVAEQHVPEAVRTQLNEVLKSGSLPSNVYFRRFTRFDDGKEMHGVWSVRLVVDTNEGPVYSVPVRSKLLYSRPYTQMERQQNASGMTLINRFVSYFEEPPNIQLLMEIPEQPIAKLIGTVESAIKAKDLKAFESVFDWRDVNDTTREFVASEFQMLTNAKIHSIKARSKNYRRNLIHWSAWQYYQPNMEVFGFLDIEYTPELAEGRKTLSLEMGQSGNEFRLINYITKGERTPPESLNPGPSITGRLEPLADGTHLVTDIITNPGTLLSAHLANEEIRQRDFREVSEQEEDSPAAEQPNASTDTPPGKTGTLNSLAQETKASADQKPPAAEKTANRYRVLSANGELVSNAVVRLIHQTQTFRELISHDLKYETKTDAEGNFEYPAGLQVANEMDNGGFSATWITLPARDGQPAQSWLLGSSAGVRFPFFEAIGAMMRDPKKASPIAAASADKDAKSIEFPNVFRLPEFETTIRVVNADGSPAAGVQVTPSQIAWARVEGGSKNIVVPDIVRDSLSRTTDADGRVTFATIDRMEFAEIEFLSERHGRQRTFTNMNTIGPELEHDVVLFSAGKVTGTIKASTAEQKEFLRTNKLLLQTKVINFGLPAPKGFRIAMEGIAEVTPDEQGRFEIPAMMAGQMFMLDQLPENSLHRITLKPRQITKSAESSLIEGDVISAVKIHGIARQRDSQDGVAGIPISVRHGGQQAGLSRELTVYSTTDADGGFAAHVFPGRVGYSSLASLDGYVQAWNWDQDYDAKQEWLYGQRIVVPGDTSSFELPPLEFVRTKEIRGKLVDTDGKPIANTEVYARARDNQNGNDFAKTDSNGEFVLKGFADGYFPEAVQVGEQFKLRPVRIISRDPLILQDSQPAAK